MRAQVRSLVCSRAQQPNPWSHTLHPAPCLLAGGSGSSCRKCL